MPTFTHGKTTRFFLSPTAATLTGLSNAAMLVLANVYDVGQFSKEVSFPRKMDTAETSTFGSNQKSYVQGLSDQTLSISGSWDYSSLNDLSGGNAKTGGLDQLMAEMIGATTNPSFLYAPTGVGNGKVFYNGTVVMTSYQVSGSIGDLVGFSAEFQVASFSSTTGRLLWTS